jgi:hypothetical protein
VLEGVAEACRLYSVYTTVAAQLLQQAEQWVRNAQTDMLVRRPADAPPDYNFQRLCPPPLRN